MRLPIKRLFDALKGILLGITASVLLFAIAAAGLLFGWPGHIVYWRSEESIEAYLKAQTPLGCSQVFVTQWLRGRGVGGEIHEAVVKPNSDYPPTKIGGTSFIGKSIAHYGLIFRTDIEAFYIFDSNRTLVDLRVRRTVNAL